VTDRDTHRLIPSAPNNKAATGSHHTPHVPPNPVVTVSFSTITGT
ncbi:uncharacterized protein METZ01_LOCUS367012, partial [marine metagenome]